MAEDNVTASPFTSDSLPQTFDFFNRSGVGSITGGLPTQFSEYRRETPSPSSAPADDSIERFRSQMESVNKAVSSPWPTILSIAAALKGDFKPAFQLQEQKLKTAVGLKLTPLFQEARKRAIQGDTEGAQTMLNEIAGRYSGRAPEFAQLASKASEEIAKKTQTLQSDKSLLQALQDKIKRRPELEPAYAGELDTVKYHVGSKLPLAPKVHDEIAQKLGLKTQIIGGRLYEEGPSGVISRPTEAVVSAGDVTGIAGDMLSSGHGLTPKEALDVLNGVTVMLRDGRTIEKGSPEAETIRKDWVGLAPVRQAVEYSKNIQYPPEIQMQLAAQGLDPLSLGLRQVPWNQMSGAIQADYARKRQIAYEQGTGAVMAGIDFDPEKMTRMKVTPIDITPNAETFGTNLTGRLMTVADYRKARASGQNVILASDDVNQKVIQPGLQGVRDIQAGLDMLKSIDNPDGAFNAAASGAAFKAAQLLGHPVAEGQVYRQVARELIERGINITTGTAAIDSRLVSDLRNFATSPLLTNKNKQEIVDSLGVLQDRVLKSISKAAGAGMSIEEFQRSSAPSSPPPYVTPPKGKGTATPPPRDNPYSTFGGKPPPKGDVEGAISGALKGKAAPKGKTMEGVHSTVPGREKIPADLGAR